VRRETKVRQFTSGDPTAGRLSVAAGDRVYAIAGGPNPGLFVSDAKEFLLLR
jgi:hypothetical protein